MVPIITFVVSSKNSKYIKMIRFVVFVTFAVSAILAEDINRINSVQKLWKARPNTVTAMGERYVQRLLGAKFSESKKYRTNIQINDNIPETFDAREQWAECVSISSIKNQGNCGSCWAVAAAGVASDRICIASNGNVQVNISAEELVSCCSACTEEGKGGCDGGYSDQAWNYFKDTGLVTGGDYKSNDGCQPYEISPNNGMDNTHTPPCHSSCTNQQYPLSFDNDKHYGSSSYDLPQDVATIQSDILKNGPVETGFIVYSDFKFYSSGVYIQTSKEKKGGHAVRIIGWGVENGVDYWLVANSWGRNWGENGTFKIRRGTNECEFESNAIAGEVNHSVFRNWHKNK